jgi:hypothetical protein
VLTLSRKIRLPEREFTSIFLVFHITHFFIEIQPHLFHDPLDNEPLMACVQTSPAPPMLNREYGFEEWLMPGIAA